MRWQVSVLGFWCVLVLPASVAARCTAKMFVLLFSTLMLLLAIPMIIAGSVSLEPSSPWSRAVRTDTASVLIGTGCAMLTTALAGLIAAVCAPPKHCNRVLLSLVMLFTSIALAISTAAAAVALSYARVVEIASIRGVADLEHTMTNLERKLVSDLETTFEIAWDECSPMAFATDGVRSTCKELRPYARCGALPEGMLAFFCGKRDGPFDLNLTLAVPSISDTVRQATTAPLAWWLDGACLPTLSEYDSMVDSSERANGTAGHSAARATFDTCMNASWWHVPNASWWQEPRAYQMDYPNGTQASPADKVFFQHLAKHRRPMTAQMAFCFCVVHGSGSFVEYIKRHSSLKWAVLSASVGFALITLVSECYLCSGLKQRWRLSPEEQERAAQATELMPKLEASAKDASDRFGQLSAWPGKSVRDAGL